MILKAMETRKVALVTGGSRGLGAEIALALGRAGYAVAVNYLSNQAEARNVAGKAGGGSAALRADVSSREEVEAMAGEVRAKWGRLDVLVNNAGIARDALIARLSEADWDRVLAVNLRGCLNAIEVFTPLLKEAGGGHVVNVSSRSGAFGKEGQAAYSASKAAVLGLTRRKAAELGEFNIRVNAVLPGYMPTAMGKSAPAAMERARRESALLRLADPAEAASFIVWLAGTGGITGQVFSLDSRLPGIVP